MFESLSGFFSAALMSKWAALAGGLLVAAPIIIHLINRMRFKRVRWAAMEFLLKAQKKMKRKMIVEQLLLLILRILLMILVGLLIARFSGFDFAGQDSRATQHLILLDDSPSMGDQWQGDDNVTTDALAQARKVIVEQIYGAVGKAPTAQFLDVAVASRGGESPRPFGQVGIDAEAQRTDLNAFLKSIAPSTVRSDLATMLRTAKATLQAQGKADKAQALYVVSDMRASDWEEKGEAVKLELEDLKKAGVVVRLIDVVHPFRRPDRRAPMAHDNIGVVDLIPSKPVVARYEPVEFILKVKNFGAAEVKDVRFDIKVNGDDNKGRSVQIASLPPGQVTQERFELTLDEPGSDPKLLVSPDAVFDPATDVQPYFKRFSIVTAVLATPERGGIAADNARHCVVEVREKLPVLVVDGAKANARPGDKVDGQFVYMNQYFANASSGGRGFQITENTPAMLERADLSRYAMVLLLNVAALSEPAAKNVEAFVKNGGGCGVFMGDDVKPAEYNKLLYRDGAGFFPVALPENPTPKPTDDQLALMLLRLTQQKFLLRDPNVRTHPALSGLYLNERGQPVKPNEEIVRYSQFVTIKQYFKLDRNGKWRDDKSVTELFCMPNEEDVAGFAEPIKAAREKLAALVADAELQKYAKPIGDGLEAIRRELLNDGGLGGLAIQFDRLLCDGRSEGDPNEPLLREFWAQPKAADLRLEFSRIRDRVKFGDPLYLAKQFGRGRVTVMLTSANESWTDWPSAQPGNSCFIPLVKEMVNYLSGGGSGDPVACGQPIGMDLPAAGGQGKEQALGYDPRVRKAFVTVNTKTAGGPNNDAVKTDFTDLKDAKLTEKDGGLTLTSPDTAKPGVYLFGLVQLRPGAGDKPAEQSVEFRAVAVNLDPREGDLRRVTTDDLAQHAPGVPVHSPDDSEWTDKLQNKKSDLSETGWMFLALLLVLVLEQALAVRLSYHNIDDGLSGTAPSAAAAFNRGTPRPAQAE